MEFTLRMLTGTSSPTGSVIFSLIALVVLSFVVLQLLRHYLPLRTTPAYILAPIFFAIFLPAQIVLLVPIDLASSAREQDVGNRGIWLPDGVLLVCWRIAYWLTFTLTWFILPILASYADAGHREPKARLLYSLRENAQYQAMIGSIGLAAVIYFFAVNGSTPKSLKGTLMAASYVWGLMLAVYLMGHGLVAIPRSLFRNSSISGRLRRIQAQAPKTHEEMENAIQLLEELEAQVASLAQRKTGSAMQFKDWIDELADDSHVPDFQPRTLSRRLDTPTVNVPNVITERYLADLARKLVRARHGRARYLDAWDKLIQEAVENQTILDSAASKRIEIGQASPHSSSFDKIVLLTPYTRHLYKYYFLPYFTMFLAAFLSLASFCIIWSEVIKSVNPIFSIISLTVVHHRDSARGQIGFSGQVIASCWILYMCAAAFTSFTQVKVWRGRALVRRNTHGESAMWYAGQVAKLSVPLSFNFMTFLPVDVYEQTQFYKFLGVYINFTPLGEWFDSLFPVFVLIPVSFTLFNLYGKIKSCLGYGDIIDEDEENETGYATGSWREGRNLIDRELQGQNSPAIGRQNPGLGPSSGQVLRVSPRTPGQQRSLGQELPRPVVDRQAIEPDNENFLEAFGHRVRNTLDTIQKPDFLENVRRPKWMGGSSDGEEGLAGNSGSSRVNITRWFAGGDRQDGRVILG